METPVNTTFRQQSHNLYNYMETRLYRRWGSTIYTSKRNGKLRIKPALQFGVHGCHLLCKFGYFK